ncbi:MAG: type III secretion system chaperone [Shinella sp.]|uniref:type III secretion system chaperone n=1 Tax=Shinella sp. TaxID=1870904 RepID=UPI0040375C82
MANPATENTLALALEEKLGTRIGEMPTDRIVIHFADGGLSEAHFQPNGREVLLSAPIGNAHRGVPAPILRGLLAHNAPGDTLAGGTLRARPDGETLEVADMLPLALGADAIANIMINQVNAASAISRQIAEQIAASA